MRPSATKNAPHSRLLRDALARCPSRRYPTTWLDQAQLSDDAERLTVQRDAAVVTADATTWLPQLEVTREALRYRTADPITIQAAAWL